MCKPQCVSAVGAFKTGVLSQRRFRAAQVKKVRKASTGVAENCFSESPTIHSRVGPGGTPVRNYPIIAGIDLTWLCRSASNFALDV